MRTPAQTRRGVESDLVALSKAYDRAARNTTRAKKENEKVLMHLSELVKIYTREKHEGTHKSLPRAEARRVAERVA